MAIVWPYGMLATECVKGLEKKKRLSPLETLKAYIPLYNLVKLDQLVFQKYNSPMKFVSIAFLGAGILTLLTTGLIFFMPSAVMFFARIVFQILTLVTLALIVILSVVQLMKLCETFGEPLMKGMSFVPPLCCVVLSNKIRPFLKKESDRLADTFKQRQ
jgi:hypothetical protein